MDIIIGEITDVIDETTHEVEFSSVNYIEKATAYPLIITDQPTKGAEIALIEFDSLIGSAYYYILKKNDDYIRFRYKGKEINITESEVKLNSKKAEVIIKDDGFIRIKNDKTSLKKILSNIINSYMKTKTLKGEPLNPTSIKSAVDNLKELNKLLR